MIHSVPPPSGEVPRVSTLSVRSLRHTGVRALLARPQDPRHPSRVTRRTAVSRLAGPQTRWHVFCCSCRSGSGTRSGEEEMADQQDRRSRTASGFWSSATYIVLLLVFFQGWCSQYRTSLARASLLNRLQSEQGSQAIAMISPSGELFSHRPVRPVGTRGSGASTGQRPVRSGFGQLFEREVPG